MSFSLEWYQLNRRKFLEQLDQLIFTYDEMKYRDVEQIRQIKQELLHSPFQIVVVGEFSRGKSTFINGLLGRRLLPSSAKPTTTILNIISYGKEPAITLHFRNPQKPSKRISEEAFSTLVAPKEPMPGDRESEQAYLEQVSYLQSIQFADIEHPLSFLEDGVQIIDTPGTNDLDPAREQITNEIIPKSDAAILLLNATKILSESEVSFLRDRLLASDIQKIFVVINFKDLLQSDADREKVLVYARDHLEAILHEPKLFLVAAKQALNVKRSASGETLPPTRFGPQEIWDLEETGVPELERALAHFLQHDRGAVKLAKPIQRAKKSIQEAVTKVIQFEHVAYTTSIQDLHSKVEQFRPKLQNMNNSGADALRTIEIAVGQEEMKLVQWYEAELQSVASTALQVFDLNRNQSTSEITRRIEDAIAPLERAVHQRRKEKLSAAWKQIIEQSSRTVQKDWLQLQSDIHHLVQPGDYDETAVAVIQLEAGQVHNDFQIFDDILEELEDAWGNQRSGLGKLAVGAGFVLTVAVGVLSHVAKGIFSLFFGGSSEDPKAKLRQQVNEQFLTTRREKITSLKKEWKSGGKKLTELLQERIHQQVSQLEEQLAAIQAAAGLEESEIQRKLEVLHRREIKLTAIMSELDSLIANITTQPKG